MLRICSDRMLDRTTDTDLAAQDDGRGIATFRFFEVMMRRGHPGPRRGGKLDLKNFTPRVAPPLGHLIERTRGSALIDVAVLAAQQIEAPPFRA